MVNTVGVELYPADEHCVQGCADCPRAVKQVERDRKTPYYSERTMGIVRKLQKCSLIGDVQFASISNRTTAQHLIPYPQMLATRSFVFGIGEIPQMKTGQIGDWADGVFDNAALCLADQSKERPFDINFSVVPKLDEKLGLDNLEALMEFFSRILKRTVSPDFDFPISHLIFGLSANDVDRKALVESLADFGKVQETQSVLRKMILDLTRDGGTRFEVTVESLSQDFDVAVRRDRATVMSENFGMVSVAQRLIEENRGKQRKKELNIDDRWLDVNIALFDDYAWLYHSKDVIADKSLFIPYTELEPIIDRCIADRKLSLRKELNSWINRKRALKVVG